MTSPSSLSWLLAADADSIFFLSYATKPVHLLNNLFFTSPRGFRLGIPEDRSPAGKRVPRWREGLVTFGAGRSVRVRFDGSATDGDAAQPPRTPKTEEDLVHERVLFVFLSF